MVPKSIQDQRQIRQKRVRAKVVGSKNRPRLCVSVTNNHVFAQLIDDSSHRTIAASSSLKTKTKGTLSEKAGAVGTDIAKKAKSAKIKRVVFDRGPKLYHGRLKTMADAARKEGLEF